MIIYICDTLEDALHHVCPVHEFEVPAKGINFGSKVGIVNLLVFIRRNILLKRYLMNVVHAYAKKTDKRFTFTPVK